MTLAATPLAGDFPAPTRDAWLALVETVLKGQPFDKRLVKLSADGVAVQPLYTAENSSPPAGPLTAPRDPERPWDLRSQIAHPDPATANQQGLHELENGAASLLVRLDPTGQTGVAATDSLIWPGFWTASCSTWRLLRLTRVISVRKPQTGWES